MTMFLLFVLGTVGFVAITYFEQFPVLGWLGALVSVVAWVAIARASARVTDEAARAGVRAAVVGAWTGLVGAVSAWALQTGNLLEVSTHPLARVGAVVGVVWGAP